MEESFLEFSYAIEPGDSNYSQDHCGQPVGESDRVDVTYATDIVPPFVQRGDSEFFQDRCGHWVKDNAVATCHGKMTS
jgi:hypothetical protein